jgi:uncharacterized membrane-anchored protein
MKAWQKLLIVAAIQFAILLSLIAVKQYAIWTATTVLLRTAPLDPRDLMREDNALRYEISTIDRSTVTGDQYPYADAYGDVYVELQRGDDGYWGAVAIHDDRTHSYPDTVIIKGELRTGYSGGPLQMHYGIEQVFIPEGSGSQLPTGTGHTVAVEVKVDRFGNAVPRRFLVDGQPFDLKRR